MYVNTLIQDLGTLLLAAGLAAIICKRLGLSVIVGYLVAGILIGPHTFLHPLIQGEERISELSELGLVFVMFAIGLELSLSKLGKLGFATIAATGLGAIFMLIFTLVLGVVLEGWTPMMSLFVAAMLMVSSSAVIAKIMHEMKLNHDRVAQMALAMTIVEDVVAVIMLTVLGASVHGGVIGNGESVGGLGEVVLVLGTFVAVLVVLGLLVMPRVLKRLEKRNDPEIQIVLVVGLLLLCTFLTVQAGYSLVLGAFLFGAVVAEIKQKTMIEHNFEGLKYVFSSVFFVSIGMMIDLRTLEHVWPTVVALTAFALFVRPLACGFALMLVGMPPRQARRGGMLLTPLGEFTFIIALAGISAGILPKEFYPVAVGLSICTVLATPILNRFADPILDFAEKVEPRFLMRAIAAYQGWLREVQARRSGQSVWKLVRGRLLTLVVVVMFVSGLLIFSERIFEAVAEREIAKNMDPLMLNYVFWGALFAAILVPIVAIWQNASIVAMVVGEPLGGTPDKPMRLQARVLTSALRAAVAVGMAHWLHTLLPMKILPLWGWLIVGFVAVTVAIVFSNKFARLHSRWEHSVQEVLDEDSRSPRQVREEARVELDHSLADWDVNLVDCIVPRDAEYAGKTLAELAISTRFGCSVIEIERNGYVFTAVDSAMRLYPGDNLLLLGMPEQIDDAREFLALVASSHHQDNAAQAIGEDSGDVFGGSVLETFFMPECEHTGKTLVELRISQVANVRVASIRRGSEQITNPSGDTQLLAGDYLLVVGTIVDLREFRNWLINSN